MEFPIRKELIQTDLEGIYLRPDYEPDRKARVSDVNLAKDLLKRGFCDVEGKMCDHPKHIGVPQARDIIASYTGALDNMGKRG